MFPLDFNELIAENSLLSPILLMSCISFEERCKAIPILLSDSEYENILWNFFEIIDNESTYRVECKELQETNIEELRTKLNIIEQIPSYNIFDSNLIEDIIENFVTIMDENEDIKTIILDISTMPKICYIPFLKWLFIENDREYIKERDFIISYTKPMEYGSGEIESEPLNPDALINFIDENKKAIWVPSLGFKSEFTKKLWENLNILEIEIDVIPIMSFPTYRPDYYDRSLILHVKTFESDKDFKKILKDKTIHCAADDPFAVYNIIKELSKLNPEDQIILSPIGSKPTSLGLALAGIILNHPIFSIQAKTYHPEYSRGINKIMCYWIFMNGEFTFT